jgi:hypothetical protein
MNSSTRISATLAGLRLVINMAHLVYHSMGHSASRATAELVEVLHHSK